MKHTILVVTYGGGHATMVSPVIHRLRESAAYANGALEIKVLGLPSAKGTLRRNGIECLGFEDFLDPVRDADALRWGSELAKVHHSPTLGIDLKESVAYLGLNYKDLVTRLGKEGAELRFEEKGRNAFFPLTIMERIFDVLQPDFVVTTNSPRSEAAALAVATKRGINNLSMTDLFTGIGGYQVSARNITFLNELALRKFKEDGRLGDQESNYFFTGNPAFDRCFGIPAEKDESWIKTHFPQADGRPLVLHADALTYWDIAKERMHVKTPQECIDEWDGCYRAAVSNGAVFLARPHPSQDRGLIQEWLQGRKDAFLAADLDLYESLRNVDLVLVRSTTVGIEAACMKKRVLQLDCDLHTDSPLIELGIAWGVNGYADLPDAMREALTDERRYEEIKRGIPQVLPTKPAAPTIAEIILRQLEDEAATPSRKGAA